MPLVLPTGCRTRTSCPATTASASSPPSCPSTTAAPVAKECVATAPRSGGRFRRGAGTTLCGSAPAATGNLGTFNTEGLPSSEHWREPLTRCFTSVNVKVLSCFCGKEVFRRTQRTFSRVPVAFVEQPGHVSYLTE